MPARASREAGEIPARTRRCDRGRRLHEATASSLAGRRGRRTIREPEDLSPSALSTLCVVNGAAAARAVAPNTGSPGPTKCRPGLLSLRSGRRCDERDPGAGGRPRSRGVGCGPRGTRAGTRRLAALPMGTRSRSPSLVCAGVAVAVQAGLGIAHVAPFVVPPPSAVLRELAADPGLYLHDTLVTLGGGGGGPGARRGHGLRLRRRRPALAPAGQGADAARRRLADGARDRPRAAPRALAGLRRSAARRRLRAHRLLPAGGHVAPGPARHRRAAAPAAALAGRAAGSSSGACGCPAPPRTSPPGCAPRRP